MRNKRIALIPAYKPCEKLLPLAAELRAAGFTVVAVDDGSGDEFSGIFDALRADAAVLVHDVNRGKGRALKTGLEYISENLPDARVIVTLDADGQHRVADALRVCEAAEASPGVLALGCRSFDSGVPARSRFGNTFTRWIYRLSTGSRVSDTQTGLRAFDAGLLPFMLGLPGERYEYEMNMLIECPRKNIPMKEVGIETVYFDNNSGSHFNTVTDSFRVYRELLKFAASSAASFCVDYGAYSLLSLLTAGLGGEISVPLSNVSARIISASFNFFVNRRLVFKSDGHVVKSALQYFSLAACIMLGNTLLLSVMVNRLGVDRYVGKLICEVIFFTLSWTVQKLIIFKRKDKSDPQ